MATLSGSSCVGYALFRLPETVYKAERPERSCKIESPSAATMKALSLCLLVVVVGSCAGQSIQQLLDNIGINSPTATEEIRVIFSKNNQHNVLSCLVNNVPVDTGRPCDARTATFREILSQIDASGYNCNCPSQPQVDAFVNLIRNSLDGPNCNALKTQLNLQNLRC